MWHKDHVLEGLPTLTSTGKQIVKKKVVQNPTPSQLWFSFAEHCDIDGLKRMLAQGFDINHINENGDNIGFIACLNNNYSVLSFFVENEGNIYNHFNLHDDSLIDIVSYPSINSKIFKIILDAYIVDYIDDPISFQFIDTLLTTTLFDDDLNFKKIIYLFTKIDIEQHEKFKSYILNKIKFKNNSQIILYLKNLSQLRIQLNAALSPKISDNHRELRKI